MRRLLIALISICFLLSGCETQNESPFKQSEFPAAVGDIVIKSEPKKIISLSPAYTEIICELGFKDKLAAVSRGCSYPPDVKKLPAVDTGIYFDSEKISAMSPDLIITQTSLSAGDLNLLYGKNIQVLTISFPTKINDIHEIYSKLAVACAGNLSGLALGAKAYSALETELAKTVSALPKSKPSFLYSIDLKNIFATPDAFESDVLSLFGKNFITRGSKYKAKFGDRKITPDAVFINAPYELDNAREAKALKHIPAVKKGRVYIIKSEYFNSISLRLAQNIKKIAKTLYPDIKIPK